MASIKMLRKRVDALDKVIKDGLKFDGDPNEVAEMQEIVSIVQADEKLLIPLRDSAISERDAKEQKSNEALLKNAGLNVNVQDAVLAYIKQQQANGQSAAPADDSANQIGFD